jgi:hypothetical protein
VAAGEDCVVVGLESFPMGSSVRVAGNTVCAQMHARARRIRWLHENTLGNALIPLTTTTDEGGRSPVSNVNFFFHQLSYEPIKWRRPIYLGDHSAKVPIALVPIVFVYGYFIFTPSEKS